MSNVKFQTAEKEINGTKYICQFSGMSTALRAIDESYIDGTQNTSVLKLAEYLFKYVVVEPKNLAVDDFVDMDEFNEVVAFAREVMQGVYFRKEANKEPVKGKGTK